MMKLAPSGGIEPRAFHYTLKEGFRRPLCRTEGKSCNHTESNRISPKYASATS